MRTAIGSDHPGYELKELTAKFLRDSGDEAVDVRTSITVPVDYPDFAAAAGKAIVDGRAGHGVLIRGNGVSASMAANKIKGIRAGLCHDTYPAHQGMERDDMNVLELYARVIGPATAQELVGACRKAKFTNEERHVRRLGKVRALESQFGS